MSQNWPIGSVIKYLAYWLFNTIHSLQTNLNKQITTIEREKKNEKILKHKTLAYLSLKIKIIQIKTFMCKRLCYGFFIKEIIHTCSFQNDSLFV